MDQYQEIKKQQHHFIVWTMVAYIFISAMIIFFSSQLSALSSDIQDKKSQILAIQNRENNINQLQEKYYQIANDITLVKSVLPDEENIADFVKYLEELSQQNKVNMQIMFGDKANTNIAKNNYLIFDLITSGIGSDIYQFWQKLEDNKYFVSINNFQIISSSGFDSDTKLTLKAKVFTNDPYQSYK